MHLKLSKAAMFDSREQVCESVIMIDEVAQLVERWTLDSMTRGLNPFIVKELKKEKEFF